MEDAAAMSNQGGQLKPKFRRKALQALGRDVLAVVSDAFELDVGDRRVTDNHVDALIRIDFKELLVRSTQDSPRPSLGRQRSRAVPVLAHWMRCAPKFGTSNPKMIRAGLWPG
ncbi:MAG: hypothetical protein DRI90_04885 [Deltaproteobacteria bacterium]|nr:MAG: hypothetical protein DRI90_04885 [Deltaproteobacteria bacterium]